jgi:hypothetical protein
MTAPPERAPFDRLIAHLRRWERRRRLRDTTRWLPRGVLAGLLLAAILATVARLRPFLTNDEVGIAALTLALAGLLTTVAGVWLPRRSILNQARFADAALGLRERTSTAVEIAHGALAVPADLRRQQLGDALDAAGKADVQAALPLLFHLRDWLLVSLAAVLLAAAVYLPNPQGEILSARRALAQEIEEQAVSLEALVEEIEANDALAEEQKETLTAPLEAALDELALGDLTREEAVAALSEAEAELRDLRASNDTGSLQSGLREAAQPLAQNPAGEQLGGSLQAGNLSGAAAQAAALAAGLTDLSDEEQAALAQALAEAAAALANVDGALAGDLAAAAEALQTGDLAAAQAALQEAAENLQQRAQQQAAAQQAGSAAGQLAQGRQQVAQAGQPDAGSQPGQGNQPGQGSGQGSGSGAGSGSGQGSGSGVGTGGNGGTGAGGGVGGTDGETGHATNLYVPDFADLSGVTGEDVELPAECVANPAACGALLDERATEFGDEISVVPYQRVFGEYRDAAYQALEDEYIPLGLKGYVRDYFSSLEP